VAKRAVILIAVAAVCHLLVQTGVLPTGISEQAEGWTVSIIDGIAALGAIFWIRSGTTPADPALAPTSANGLPLVEAPPQHRRTEAGERLASNVKVTRYGLDSPRDPRPTPTSTSDDPGPVNYNG
jgi:hypothetical protein